MKKAIILACALAMALVAVPAFASVQNVRVYGNVDSTYIYRTDFDFGFGLPDDEQSDFITQTRLGIDADLTDNVSVTVGLINERIWSADNTNTSINDDTDVDLYLAYVTLREMLYSPLTVIVGRQQWSYGNSLIFDATGTNNVAPTDSGIRTVAADLTYQTSLDAVRFILDYDPLTIETFYSMIDENSNFGVGTTDDVNDDKDLIGINATYQLGDDMDSVVESYFFKLNDRSTSTDSGKTDTIYVYGLRGSTNPVEGLNVQGEFAWQSGTDNDTDTSRELERDAFIIQAIVNYQLPIAEQYNPIASYAFTYASGDSDTDSSNPDGKQEAWDPFYEAQAGGTVYNTLFDLTNLMVHSISLETNPIEDVTATVSWHGLWLVEDQVAKTFSLRQPNSSTTTVNAKRGEDQLGYEFDLDLSYAYTEDVTIGASLGWFFPGDVFTEYNDSVAKQALVSLGVAF